MTSMMTPVDYRIPAQTGFGNSEGAGGLEPQNVRQDLSPGGTQVPRVESPEATQSKPPATQEALQMATEQINQSLQTGGRSLQFRIDQNTGRTIISVVDSDTDQVIRQIPSEQVMELAARMRDGVETPGSVLKSIGIYEVV